MATIKSYTNLEQSHKLAEILPLESADCFWDYDDLQKYHRISWFEEGYDKDSQLRTNENNVCAWSLAALLNALPRIKNLKPVLDLEFNYVQYETYDIDLNATGDNPVDACYELILKLNELNLL